MFKESAISKEEIIRGIWSPPANWSVQGAWFWWFWLFFIHTPETEKTGKCEQLMILWSIKKDRRIDCNGLDIQIPVQIEGQGKGKWKLNGAAAAWYFDGKEMHDNFVLEKSQMELDLQGGSLLAPGATPSSFCLEGGEYVTKISSGGIEFEFSARQTDSHASVGPNYGKTSLPLGMEIEGTRIEILELSGTQKIGAETRKITGTAYFQKILVAAPPPQWYWGIYHFKDGSFFTYMLPYAGRAALAGNLWKEANLKPPAFPIQQDISFYHAPSGRFFEGNRLSVIPKNEGNGIWSHEIKGGGKGFEISATARAYAHSCWAFRKKIGILPASSTFRYNEYPSVLERLEFSDSSGKRISLSNGWGNMENSWGFII